MEVADAVAIALVPPLCAACGRVCRPEAVLCNRCGRRLARAEPFLSSGPAGLDKAWSSAPYEGVARGLVGALKFRRLLPVADLMAERIEWLAPAHMLSGTIVPVPPAPVRLRRRGFDPAGELAGALAERLEGPLEGCLERRGGGRDAGGPGGGAGRSGAPAPSGWGTRRGSMPPAPLRAASSSSTTSSPPGRPSRLPQKRCGPRGRLGWLR